MPSEKPLEGLLEASSLTSLSFQGFHKCLVEATLLISDKGNPKLAELVCEGCRSIVTSFL